MSETVASVFDLPKLPRRVFDAHKGTFGKVLIVAGSRGMAGAAVLCGRAALRSGAGLVQVASPASAQPIVAASHPCYTTLPIHQHADGTFSEIAAENVIEWARGANAIAIGPGLGCTPDVGVFARRILEELPRMSTVVDADALNVLSPWTDEFKSRPCPLVLTPHPGEFCRLSGKPMADVQTHREAVAIEFAARFNVVLVLKGAGTIVTDGTKIFRNATGNPGMATGGSGDVLTGLIGSLLGQHLTPFDAACLGVAIHGRAGDLAAAEIGQTGLIATDIIEALPKAFREHEA
jgi:NAD(P)H-hydrate epimerase